ncbi:MAG: alpha-ketoglutarate-dependent dioxygenase AlkB [Acidobacteria bacterium]|nr:alpha-ketoglutarate-dependent dioxygenase AlkB [Acidobacteriota bacterium]
MQSDLISEPIITLQKGVTLLRGFLSKEQQLKALEQARTILQSAPLFTPRMKDGTSFRQNLSNCGEFGWIADANCYRYIHTHPITGKRWPDLPQDWQDIAEKSLAAIKLPACHFQSCLFNWYKFPNGRLGMHQDKTEKDLKSPIVTISLGNPCSFKVAETRNSASQTITLYSGDILIMHGEGRMAWHGVMKLLPTNEPLTRVPGRLSLTLRKVE